MTDPKSSPIPAAVRDKMEKGVRQRFAVGTTESAQPKMEKPRS